MRIELRMLGPLEVRVDGVPVDLGPPKRRVVLAMLVASTGSTVPVEALLEEVWGADPPRSARANLRSYVASLRAMLPATRQWRLASGNDSYALHLDNVEYDVDEFRRLADGGRSALAAGEAAVAARSLERALALWRGRCAEDVPRGPHLTLALDALDEQRVAAHEEYVEARLIDGEHDRLPPLLRRLIAEYPLRERLWGQLMLALYRTGDIAGALRTFGEARAALVTELGVEPGGALQTLHRAMLERDERLAAPAVIGRVPRELPPAPAMFVARAGELTRLGDVLTCTVTGERARVVAIHGPGGVGKSALAVTAAHRHAAGFPDGQLYVDLRGAAAAGLRPLDPAEALGRLLRALGIPPAAVPADVGEASALYRSHLADRAVLIVADNGASAEQVEPLIPASGRCAVIVTSRRVLGNLDGAVQLPLSSLSEGDSVRLLRALSGAAADDTGVTAVARHCAGMPLALRIAAARLVSRPDWTFDDLARRLGDTQHSLAEFEIGNSGVRRSLQVSYRELEQSADPTDRLAADALRSIGGLRLETFPPALVGTLLAESQARTRAALDRMVEARLADATGGRYAMHDLVRRFAAELATRSEETTRAHGANLHSALSWYAAHARRVSELFRPEIAQLPALTGAVDVPVYLPDAPAGAAWLEQERANVVALVDQAVESGTNVPLAAQLVLGLYPSMLMRSYARDWEIVCRQILSVRSKIDNPAMVLRIANYLAAVYRNQSRLTEALECVEVARALVDEVDEPASRAHTHEVLAMIQVSLDRDERAVEEFERALALRELGHPLRLGITLSNAAEPYFKLGRYQTAIEYLERSVAIRRKHGDGAGAAIALNNLGEVWLHLGEYDAALVSLDEAVELNRHTDREAERNSHCLRARVFLKLGRADDASTEVASAIGLAEESDGVSSTHDLRGVHRALLAADQRRLADDLVERLAAIDIEIASSVADSRG